MKQFDFLKHSKIYYIISAAIVLVTIVATVVMGLNVDIQFKGGSVLTYSFEGEIKTSDVEALVKKTIGFRAKARISEAIADSSKNVVVSIADEISAEQQIKLSDALEKEYKDNKLALAQSSSVDAMMGRNFFIKCLIAVAFAAALMGIYIAFRFKNIGGWTAGATAVIALVHDLIVCFAVYVIFRIEIGGNFMAVMLTILGYSINDTIVIFDRVRENKDNFGKKLSVADNITLSLNQCTQRAINTTATTLMALAVIVIVCLIYNIDSMFNFVFPMAVGLISGVYSSMFLAPCIWVKWEEKLASKKAPRKKRA